MTTRVFGENERTTWPRGVVVVQIAVAIKMHADQDVHVNSLMDVVK